MICIRNDIKGVQLEAIRFATWQIRVRPTLRTAQEPFVTVGDVGTKQKVVNIVDGVVQFVYGVELSIWIYEKIGSIGRCWEWI